MLLVGVTVLTLVTSLSSAFHHLFLAGDLELLLVAPVPARSLFWLKVLEIWRDSLHVLLFQAAALFGFGQTLRLPPSYYPLAVLVGLGADAGRQRHRRHAHPGAGAGPLWRLDPRG